MLDLLSKGVERVCGSVNNHVAVAVRVIRLSRASLLIQDDIGQMLHHLSLSLLSATLPQIHLARLYSLSSAQREQTSRTFPTHVTQINPDDGFSIQHLI
jgi:hypothetical protein